MEVKGRQVGRYFVVDRHMLYAAQVQTQQLYPRVIATLRELAGGGIRGGAVAAVQHASDFILGDGVSRFGLGQEKGVGAGEIAGFERRHADGNIRPCGAQRNKAKTHGKSGRQKVEKKFVHAFESNWACAG